jgi:hypothetical protein
MDCIQKELYFPCSSKRLDIFIVALINEDIVGGLETFHFLLRNQVFPAKLLEEIVDN